MKLKLATLSILSALTLGVGSASASVVAYAEAGTLTDGATGTGGTGLVGFNFTLTSTINVTALGFFGDQMGGGDTPWVALYDVTTSAQLAAITTFAPTNGWQYLSLGTPVTLTMGDTYQVVATAYWSPKYAGTTGFTFGSEITSVGFTSPTGWGGWGTPVEGTPSVASTPNITGNFQYEVVPEPSADAALLAGAAGLYLLRRRR